MGAYCSCCGERSVITKTYTRKTETGFPRKREVKICITPGCGGRSRARAIGPDELSEMRESNAAVRPIG